LLDKLKNSNASKTPEVGNLIGALERLLVVYKEPSLTKSQVDPDTFRT